MYKRILVSLENSSTDKIILDHIRRLAHSMQSQITLIHVADGFQARHQERLGESEEMRKDRAYLEQMAQELRDDNLDATAVLTWGDPAVRILETAEKNQCDLIAMATHGHRMIKDLLFGSVASEVRHKSPIPVLLVKE